MSLATAVQALKSEILSGVTAAEALAFIAEEEGLNPILLERKFSESYGRSPAEYSAAPPAPLPTSTDLAAAEVQRWAAEYRMTAEGAALVGRPFLFQGERYLYVALQSGCPQWGLKAIRVKDAARRQLSRPAWDGIFAQLRA